MRMILFIAALSLTLIGAFILFTHGSGSEYIGITFTVFGTIATLIQLFFKVPLGGNTVPSTPIYTVTYPRKSVRYPSQNVLALLAVLFLYGGPILCVLSGAAYSPTNDTLQEILIIAGITCFIAYIILAFILYILKAWFKSM